MKKKNILLLSLILPLMSCSIEPIGNLTSSTSEYASSPASNHSLADSSHFSMPSIGSHTISYGTSLANQEKTLSQIRTIFANAGYYVEFDYENNGVSIYQATKNSDFIGVYIHANATLAAETKATLESLISSYTIIKQDGKNVYYGSSAAIALYEGGGGSGISYTSTVSFNSFVNNSTYVISSMPISGSLPITGTFDNMMIPDGWTYENGTYAPEYYTEPAALKIRFEGISVTSPYFTSSYGVSVNLTITAINPNIKTVSASPYVFTAYGYDISGRLVATEGITEITVSDDNWINLYGNGIAKVKVTMTGYQMANGFGSNVGLAAITVY